MAAVKFPSTFDSTLSPGPKSRLLCRRVWNTVKQPHTLLLILTLSGVMLGVISGLLLKLWVGDDGGGRKALTQRQLSYVNLLGDLFMRALKMIVLPMVFFTLVNSLAVLDVRMTGRLLATAFAYYLSTMFLATLIGELRKYIEKII
uniref:Amino acid transporter n=1 Tax=Romanomermis culicivorax TaxID=13658 RepID=A0A915KEG0_ROMCU